MGGGGEIARVKGEGRGEMGEGGGGRGRVVRGCFSAFFNILLPTALVA